MTVWIPLLCGGGKCFTCGSHDALGQSFTCLELGIQGHHLEGRLCIIVEVLGRRGECSFHARPHGASCMEIERMDNRAKWDR